MSQRASLLVLVLVIGIAAAITTAFNRIKPESSPVARGANESGIYACLKCHGKTDQAFPEDWSLSCNHQPATQQHPAYQGECEDLLAFFSAFRVQNTFASRVAAGTPNRLLAGERLARTFYCFQCHGELGQGGYPNTGALKGYVPGYFGDDFRRLTNNASPAAVKSWINNGLDPNLFDDYFEGPFAAFFIKHQAIQMPSFSSLTNEQTKLLVDYVLSIHALGPMDAATVRRYDQLSRLPSSTSR